VIKSQRESTTVKQGRVPKKWLLKFEIETTDEKKVLMVLQRKMGQI